jgi:hypothetical protein
MSSTHEDTIYGLPRRPRLADAPASAILGAIALGILTGSLGAALLGGAVGSALANRRQPLEMAIREYLKSRGLEMAFFYPAPRGVKVTFRDHANDYWTVQSVLPDNLPLSTEDSADWLYGNLITNELPQVLRRLRQAS